MFFDGFLDISTALYGSIVGDDHHLLPVDHPNAGNNAGRGKTVVVQPEGCQGRQFNKRRVAVEQQVDALADQQFSTLLVL